METLSLSLRNLEDLDTSETAMLTALFSENYSPIGDCDTAEEAYFYFRSKTVSWMISNAGIPVGLIALSPSKRAGNYYQTTTYIFPAFRGFPFNRSIKQAFAQSFLRIPEINLCSVVRDWNMRSQKAMEKTFPDIAPVQEFRSEEQKFKDPTLHQMFYDLSLEKFRELEPEELEIYAVLIQWAETTRNPLDTFTTDIVLPVSNLVN